ncbi:MAG TPA: hypothetical protein VHE33_18675 [Acidobacteriaceae bacterium]|nr:hypothetical protein [Acidobacteriaceae bacterium]
MITSASALVGCFLALLASACTSVRTDEGLVILDVSLAAGLASPAAVRFSVPERPSVPSHEVPYDPLRPLHFGYYLPGPAGATQVQAEALTASGCVVGQGTAIVDVALGRVSPAVPLVLAPATGTRPDGGAICRSVGDGAADQRRLDAAATHDARDGSGPTDAKSTTDAKRTADAHADSHPVDTSAPACLPATRVCTASSTCCSGLTCSSNSLGKVCCGAYGARCTLANGTDCCGELECINGGCCLPATRPCQGGDCCLGLTCGTTSLGKVCCGSAGAPCTRTDGADCCGTLSCRNGTCAP